VPEILFHFEPPLDSKLVAKFSDSVFGADMTGETAPEVQLVATDGKRVPLSSYHGNQYCWISGLHGARPA